MTPAHEIQSPVWALAFGLLGDRDRVLAVFLVAFEQLTYADASQRTGVPTSTISDDRRRFRKRMELYKKDASPN